MPLNKGKSNKARSENVATEERAGRDPKQAVAIAYAEQRRAKSNDRAPSLMGSPKDPKPHLSNSPASAGDPSRVPGAGARDARSPSVMGSPFDPKDAADPFPKDMEGRDARSPSLMGAPRDPKARTLDSVAMGGRDAVEHFAGGMERYAAKRDARGMYPPMGASSRKLPGGHGGFGNGS